MSFTLNRDSDYLFVIKTAKANDLEPYRYLRYLFERLPMAETEADYRALLPQYVDRDFITNMKF